MTVLLPRSLTAVPANVSLKNARMSETLAERGAKKGKRRGIAAHAGPPPTILELRGGGRKR